MIHASGAAVTLLVAMSRMPWAGDPRVNMQESKGGKAKAYQVQQLLTAIDRVRSKRERRRTLGKTQAKDVSPKGKKRRAKARKSSGAGDMDINKVVDRYSYRVVWSAEDSAS
jgi:hypothetical protein